MERTVKIFDRNILMDADKKLKEKKLNVTLHERE